MVLSATPAHASGSDASTQSRSGAMLKPALERLLRLATRLLGAPVGMIFPATSAQPFPAICIGTESALLKTALIGSVNPLEVLLDAGHDSRFAALTEVRFYVGVALMSKHGQRLGTLCVVDTVARASVEGSDLEGLRDVAASMVSELEHHSRSVRLMQERDFYSTVAQNADFIAIATDALGCVTQLNPCVERVLGISSSSAVGQPIWTLFSDAAAARLVQRAMRRARRGAMVSHGELSWVLTDGSRCHASLSCTTLCDASGAVNHVVITGVDTSALRRSELEASSAARATAQALSARGEFFNFVTHELRTPLHAISGYCDLLLDPGLGALSADQTDFAKEIRSASDHLFALISDLLDLSKINAGSVNFAPKLFTAAPLLRGCLSMLKTAAQQSGVILSLEIATGVSSLFGEERSVRQILVNLLSNAVKFTPSGGHVRLSLVVEGDWQRLAVVDTGIGLLEDDLAKIFEPFTQARNSPTHHRSFGLGLTLSRKLAEMHGGWIEVSSQLGVGSSFTLVLPREPSDQLLSTSDFVVSL